MKLNLSLFLVLFSLQSHALTLSFVGQTTIKTGTKFNNTIIGGLSGMVWNSNTLYALSDDKGRDGDPRFYEFDLKINKKNISLKPKAVRFITALPNNKSGLDPEGLALLPDGDFLISSEGNNNAKPREMPRIFKASKTGEWKADLPMPDKYLPELIGQQKKGIQNNGAFEGLSTFSDGKFVFTSVEMPLVQDIAGDEKDKGSWIRILKYEDKGKPTGYKPVMEYAYRMDAQSDGKEGIEIMRGVSEILTVSETKLIVLERGIRVSAKNLITPTLTLYLADLSKGSDISSLDSLKGAKFNGVTKTKLLDFNTDLAKECGDNCIENMEALSWGPPLADGRRSLLVLSDNNFSKKQITRFVVFAVEGE
ncbi:MAG: esterase-like activity of phytase family protein [Bdellovibrio sp.]